LTAVVSGELIAFYQVGYGIAAFGTGSLLNATGISLSTIYAGASLVAGVMIVLAFLVIRPQTEKTAELKAQAEKRKTV
jgi:Na+/H+-dicarboxylate symporter